MTLLLDRIKDSGLTVSQIINVIETFIVPKFDYMFHNMVLPQTRLEKMDVKVRNVINSLVGDQPLSKSLFFAG
jgi:hypothetical protein